MENGATLTDPASVFFSADTRLGRDVVIGPNVVFGPGVEIARRRRDPRLLPHRRRDDRDAARSSARSRACARARRSAPARMSAISSRSRSTELGAGAKANHLTYLGDADDRRRRRISAPAPSPATTTASNKTRRPRSAPAPSSAPTPSLVAPVTVGDGAIRRRRHRDHPRRAAGRAGRRARRSRSTSRAGRRNSAPSRSPKTRKTEPTCAASSASSASATSPPPLLDGLKRLEYRGYDFDRHRDPGGRPDRAPPRRGQARPISRRCWRSSRCSGDDRHRPHALGDPWPAERDQRPSARDRPGRRRP